MRAIFLLRATNLVLAFLATTAPVAHGLELFNKTRLDAPLWLAVQQQLYRGWGPVFGTMEVLALVSTVALVIMRWNDRRGCMPTVVAALCYALMIVVFFVFDDPVNRAFNSWTTTTIPADWPHYRAQWETGHALAALLSLVAFGFLVWAWRRESTVGQA